MTITDNRISQTLRDSQIAAADPVSTSLRASHRSVPNADASVGTILPTVQRTVDTPTTSDGGINSSPSANSATEPIFPSLEGNQAADSQLPVDPQRNFAVGVDEDGSAATEAATEPTRRTSLADPFLALAADVLDDAERTRIANENRLRQLTRDETDSDGEERGFGLDESHPDVARLAALVEMLAKIEHQATLNLNRLLRQHPLGTWCKAQRGVGDKQAARLLAVIGDPYWNTLYDRPRTVSQLWAYCGLHVFPVSQTRTDAQTLGAGGEQAAAGGDSSQKPNGPHTTTAGVAARRQKGHKANWSTVAKTRAYLISEAMLKAGNREAYDRRKAATVGRIHAAPCNQCGPKGKPAQPGSEWSLGHRHGDALRIQSKELLKGLWIEARRIHLEES